MKIKNLSTAMLKNHAHHQYHIDVNLLISEADPRRLGISELYVPYLATIEREDELLKKIAKSEYTEEIKIADKRRDLAYQSISSFVKTSAKNHNPDVMKAGKRTYITIKDYGNVTRIPYDAQTNAIHNILQEFRGKHAEDIVTMRIPEMVDELDNANTEFDALIKMRNEENAQKNHGDMKVARAETDKAYNKIVEKINALVVVEGPENYEAFITRINVLIDRYKLLIPKSHGKVKDETAA